MKQIIYEIKSQPLISAVTVIGTALAMFLIMVVVMLQQVKLINIAPETARDRYLYISGMTFDRGENGSGNSSLSPITASELTADLANVEASGIFGRDVMASEVSYPGKNGIIADVRTTDDGYFKVYDFEFIAGRPYDAAAVSSHLNEAVITEFVARNFFSSAEEAVGQEVEIENVQYRVVGVIADVSPVTNRAYSQVFLPYPEPDMTSFWTSIGLGAYTAVIKPEKGADSQSICDEVNRRLDAINTRTKPDGLTVHIEGAPYGQEAENLHNYGRRPDVAADRRQRALTYVVLLLIPAINLSSMTRSRLRRRVSEIGVRRAFGCTRMKVITDILAENFVITLIGGAIGLLLTVVFGSLLFDAIFSPGAWTTYSVQATLTLRSLLDWTMFAYALGFCFLLNLVSTGIPAWRASRINPVEAINSQKQ